MAAAVYRSPREKLRISGSPTNAYHSAPPVVTATSCPTEGWTRSGFHCYRFARYQSLTMREGSASGSPPSMLVFLRAVQQLENTTQASSDRRRSSLQGHFHFHAQQRFTRKSFETEVCCRACLAEHNSTQPSSLAGTKHGSGRCFPLLHLGRISNKQ